MPSPDELHLEDEFALHFIAHPEVLRLSECELRYRPVQLRPEPSCDVLRPDGVVWLELGEGSSAHSNAYVERLGVPAVEHLPPSVGEDAGPRVPVRYLRLQLELVPGLFLFPRLLQPEPQHLPVVEHDAHHPAAADLKRGRDSETDARRRIQEALTSNVARTAGCFTEDMRALLNLVSE
eukprot:CAMPEP_0182478452 /NCGR_PEP_ID=MMETSP1319-20130603/32522_1 /TAXON_ID=172717 /ORGANISM="Bolidomonas pacifica, Strain RCC208" /LENGTH=178 /DNA_ID=CAMNT_0024679793 /DNA_START=78 /DNA_END=615 /DNA_ORIENTATION=+